MRPRAFQFRLGSLLLVIAGLGLWLGTFGARIRDRKIAVETVREYGGQVYFSFQVKPEHSCSVETNADSGLPLFLIATLGEDFFFEPVAVEFRHDDVARDGVKVHEFPSRLLTQILALRRLRHLIVNGRTVSDRALAGIAELVGLETLSVTGASEVTDEGASHLARLVNLKVLDLTDSRITDDAGQTLSRLPSLKELRLDGNDLSDEAMRSIGKIVGLEELSLNDTGVTSQGLAHLTSLKNLKTLFVGGTWADTASLERELPNCFVIPSTEFADEEIRHSLSPTGLLRLVERMVLLSNMRGLDPSFALARPALEDMLKTLRRSGDSAKWSVEKVYRKLMDLVEPRDYGTRLRLAAGWLETAALFRARVEEYEGSRGTRSLAPNEAHNQAREERAMHLLLSKARDQLGLPPASIAGDVFAGMLPILEGTRPNKHGSAGHARD